MRQRLWLAIMVVALCLLVIQTIPASGATSSHAIASPSCSVILSSTYEVTSQTVLQDGSTQVVANLLSGATKTGTVTLVISPLVLSNGKYHNIQTTTVKSTTGTLMNGVAVTMFENAGKSGGYFHGVTGPTKYPNGETIEHDTYPGSGSYTEWSSATLNGQTVISLKITVIVP